MKGKQLVFCLLLALFLLLSACSAAPSATAPMPAPGAAAPSVAHSSKAAYAMAPAEDSAYAWGSNVYGQMGEAELVIAATGSAYTDAKLIRTANFSMESTDFDAAVTALGDLVARMDGYFSNSQVWGGNTYAGTISRSASYTVRVPKDAYAAFIAAVGDVAHVVHRQESAVDVGAEYRDNELRLNTARVKHERLLALLEKAEKMEDIITIESSLAQTQYEIDSLSGTLRRYDELVDFATIDISLSEVSRLSEQTGQTEPLGTRMAAAFGAGMTAAGRGVENLLLWAARNLIGLVIFALLVAAAVVVVRRVFFKKKREDVPSQGE